MTSDVRASFEKLFHPKQAAAHKKTASSSSSASQSHSPAGSTSNSQGDVIGLTYDSLDVAEATKQVSSRFAGATVLFLGSTREDVTQSQKGQSLRVTRLDYEAYTPLALKTLAAIIQRARSTPTSSWPPARLQPQRTSGSHDVDTSGPTASSSSPSIEAGETSSSTATPSTSATTPSSSPPPPDSIVRIVLLHRLGPVPTGESSILVAVSSPHRRRAFEVAEWLLEETKRIAPIWKREVRADEGGKEIVEEDEERQAGGKPVDGEKGTRGWVGLDLTTQTNEATATT